MQTEFNKAEIDFFMNALKDEARNLLQEVGSTAAPEDLLKSVITDLEALAPIGDGEPRTEEDIWKQVRERLLKAAYATRAYCVRCGTCCASGSPTLLQADAVLISKDVFKPAELVTIRKGETSYSNISEQAEVAEQETIKIREVQGTRTCIFYSEADHACSIYESRPEQCRRQECWDAKPTVTADDVPLTRQDILGQVGELWEVIQHHEQRCSLAEFTRAITRLSATHGQTVEEVLDLLGFDHYVREYVTANLKVTHETADFLFGRSLKEFLKHYGLSLEEQSDGTFLLSPIE